jgi:hypothetical protein
MAASPTSSILKAARLSYGNPGPDLIAGTHFAKKFFPTCSFYVLYLEMEPNHSDLGEYATPPADDQHDEAFDFCKFGAIPLRYRHDGWIPDRQLNFIEALADTGCVDQAARAVGMSRNAAYALRRRHDAQAFRLAWDAAMDYAVSNLSDAALSRAIHGVPVPIFHQGEQVGERRHFDERLTMFMLRYRDPVRYGKWHDGVAVEQTQDGSVAILGYRIGRMLRAAWTIFNAALDGKEPPKPEAEMTVPREDDHRLH